jgi:hypothetical protein
MSSCITSARELAVAVRVSRVLSVALLLNALVIGCKSVASTPDQPEPTPMVTPAMTPKPDESSNPASPTPNMQETPSSPMASDASHPPGDGLRDPLIKLRRFQGISERSGLLPMNDDNNE